MTWIPAKTQRIQFGWTGLAGAQGSLHGLQSEYALNYPVENIHATWTAEVRRLMTVTNSVQVAKPYQQAGVAPWNASPYPVWNMSMAHNAGRVRPYVRLGNLSNTGYQEINGVAMPGRLIVGGLSIWFGR